MHCAGLTHSWDDCNSIHIIITFTHHWLQSCNNSVEVLIISWAHLLNLLITFDHNWLHRQHCFSLSHMNTVPQQRRHFINYCQQQQVLCLYSLSFYWGKRIFQFDYTIKISDIVVAWVSLCERKNNKNVVISFTTFKSDGDKDSNQLDINVTWLCWTIYTESLINL